jgi:hypothetical protein
MNAIRNPALKFSPFSLSREANRERVGVRAFLKTYIGLLENCRDSIMLVNVIIGINGQYSIPEIQLILFPSLLAGRG